MKIQNAHPNVTVTDQKNALKEKLEKGDINGKVISETYFFEYSQKTSHSASQTFQTQNFLFDFKKIQEMLDAINTEALGYDGKKLSELTPSEAKELISDEGFFGIAKTSQRLIDFVFYGAGDNLDMLHAGRRGVIQGFNEAEKLWGNKLPDISYQTMERVLQSLDEKIASLGGNLLNTSV